MTFDPNIKIGVLGGGQLGRMMIQSAVDFNLNIRVMDPDPNAPCKDLVSEFVAGNITDYDEVLAFGKNLDLLTIEIENVNIAALKKLVSMGKKVFPQPEAIEMIKDKAVQKQFYLDHSIPTTPFVLTEGRDELQGHVGLLPAVHKLRTEGYDGRGVQVIRTSDDLEKGFDAPSILESFVDFNKEISVIVARNESGEIKTFPVVALEYHPEQNLVEFLFSPSDLTDELKEKAINIARKVISALDMVGLLAVEMFVTKNGEILVNECAPRTHNSGHHTIEGNITSQFEQHLRAILNLPLGNTDSKGAAVMVNLLGDPHHTGVAKYLGVDDVLAAHGSHIHLYGKKMTKPFRKMGHVTLVGDNLADLKTKARWVKDTIKIIS